ncbi:uncharacterized protein LOC119179393 [Rhipicephalus microplus]|uniref:uncharacterized protein LOC119179393 n=1 Tax=Rhipicephalus microplus TaxID=6941 RepID=UPI003F6B6B52
MASAGVFFLVAAVLCAAVVAEEPEPRRRYPTHGTGWQHQPQYPGGRYPYQRPCTYRCTLRLCDQYECHYRCLRGATCPTLSDLDARKGHGAEINVSKPLKEKVDVFDYVPK